MNTVQLIGRLTKNPVMQTVASNESQVARFTLAVERAKTKDGKKDADFINCVAFGKVADIIEKYAGKGKQIAVVGHIQTGTYEKDGKKVYTTDVVVDRLDLLNNAPSEEKPIADIECEQCKIPQGFEICDADIPF